MKRYTIRSSRLQWQVHGFSAPELVAAVSNAGGLGSLGAALMSADDIRKAIQKIRELTNKPFCVNLFSPEACEVSLEKQERMCEILKNKICKEIVLEVKPVAEKYIPPFEEQLWVANSNAKCNSSSLTGISKNLKWSMEI